MFRLNDLLGCFEGKRLVLFDLDGPIAQQPKGYQEQRLDEDEKYFELLGNYPFFNNHDLLIRLVREEHPKLQEIEALVTSKELLSAGTAILRAKSKEFIETLVRYNYIVGVTSNGSKKAVNKFLVKNDVRSFEEHVYARVPDNILLKPDPDCLNRAIANTGVTASGTLMIGDSWSDVAAARAAGIAFLGFAWTEDKKIELNAAGADMIIRSWDELLL